MRLPGFTADAALARSSGTYRSKFAPIAVSGVAPQQLIGGAGGGLRWTNVCWSVCSGTIGIWPKCRTVCIPVPAPG